VLVSPILLATTPNAISPWLLVLLAMLFTVRVCTFTTTMAMTQTQT
jgi:hypothetical protein